ncbi:MAG: 3-dehydroquinate synthase, partial [Gammaproteobacteria bacterium]|nr:3-dehydroquinate synthase [Gammaproteobacteria bacterium]
RVVKVTASEEAKSLERMAEVVASLRRLGAHRRTHLVAIGGGVVQDIATFSASIYMRGISWTYMPTTLLGMADSCIGGKSSINVLGYKNLVGNFYPPKDVLIDVDFTKTLSKEMLVGGLFEAGKICYARNYEAFLGYLAEVPDIRFSSLQRIILRALQTKKWFIETDEFDQKERLLLNFGHTFGHAIEAGTDYAVSHGIAVGLGMMVAVEYANDQSWLSATGKEHASVLAAHVRDMIGDGNGCIVKPPAVVDLVRVMEKFENDKKHLADAYRIVCPRHDGALELIAVPKTDSTRAGVAAAYRRALSNLAWKYAD